MSAPRRMKGFTGHCGWMVSQSDCGHRKEHDDCGEECQKHGCTPALDLDALAERVAEMETRVAELPHKSPSDIRRANERAWKLRERVASIEAEMPRILNALNKKIYFLSKRMGEVEAKAFKTPNPAERETQEKEAAKAEWLAKAKPGATVERENEHGVITTKLWHTEQTRHHCYKSIPAERGLDSWWRTIDGWVVCENCARVIEPPKCPVCGQELHEGGSHEPK